jgi:Family of unknown function (DUF6529)
MATADPASRRGAALSGVFLLGAAVAVALGAYGRAHDPALKPLFLFGFSGMLQFKTWFATGTVVLVLVQITTALSMWGRLPVGGSARGWVAPVHRWSGAVAFALSVPVALHCLWSLGFMTTSSRVLVHSVAGCAFYGAYAAKMLGLRVRGLPGWTLPVLGGLVFAALVLVWLTSALWFFTRSGLPLT